MLDKTAAPEALERSESDEGQEVENFDLPASIDAENRPTAPKVAPYKTHLAYVKERRSETEAADILTEAIETLRSKRKSGEVIF